MKVQAWLLRLSFFAVVATVGVGGSGPASAGTIDTIRAAQTIRIAYREDAPPFSYKSESSSEPAGYMVNVCRTVVKELGQQLDMPSLKIAYVPVTAANRFDKIEKHDADLLCEATSATLSRRKQVDFSIATFADGASLMTTDANIHELKVLSGRKVGVLAGTTTEKVLHDMLDDQKITAEVILAKTHDDGLAMLDSGKISAYFGDRSILMFLANRSKAQNKLFIADEYFTMEPYALALPHGDEDFRLAVDTALSHIYRHGEIGRIFIETFAGKVKPTETIKALYRLSALPD